MFLKPARTAAALAIAACASMAAAPAHATDLPLGRLSAVDAYDAQVDTADGWRHRRYRDNGIGAGEVIAGVLVLGAIAAIASAASRNRDEPRRRYPDNARNGSRDDRYDSSGIARAVDMCVAEIERGHDRVRSVDDAARDASGWRVSGVLDAGEGFTCRIGNDGRIRDIDTGPEDEFDESAYGESSDDLSGDRQYSDDEYARARADQEASEPRGDRDGARPAYPGGPLPGEEEYGEEQADDYDVPPDGPLI